MGGVDATLTIGIGIEGELDWWRLSASKWWIEMANQSLDRPCKAANDGKKWKDKKQPARTPGAAGRVLQNDDYQEDEKKQREGEPAPIWVRKAELIRGTDKGKRRPED